MSYGLNRRQLDRTDLATEIESGRRVETAQFEDNSRNSLRTMGELLNQRYFNGRVRELRTQRWEAYHEANKPVPYVDHNPRHGPWCPCDACTDAVKRLLRDVGVLPRGKA